MGLLAWVMMGLALWHFTIWLPDRYWGRDRRRAHRRRPRRRRLRLHRQRAGHPRTPLHPPHDRPGGDPRRADRHGHRLLRRHTACTAQRRTPRATLIGVKRHPSSRPHEAPVRALRSARQALIQPSRHGSLLSQQPRRSERAATSAGCGWPSSSSFGESKHHHCTKNLNPARRLERAGLVRRRRGGRRRP